MWAENQDKCKMIVVRVAQVLLNEPPKYYNLGCHTLKTWQILHTKAAEEFFRGVYFNSVFMEHRTSIFCLFVCFFCKDFGNRVLPNSIWKGWLVKTPFSSLQVFFFTFSTSATVITYFLRALSLQDWSGIIKPNDFCPNSVSLNLGNDKWDKKEKWDAC